MPRTKPHHAGTACRNGRPTPGISAAAAPSIRKLARDLGIDLTRVRGSARGGRIVLEDVRAYIQRLQRLAAEPENRRAGRRRRGKTRARAHRFLQVGAGFRQPLSPMRQVIARRMAENWTAVPRVTQFDRGRHHRI